MVIKDAKAELLESCDEVVCLIYSKLAGFAEIHQSVICLFDEDSSESAVEPSFCEVVIDLDSFVIILDSLFEGFLFAEYICFVIICESEVGP